MPKNRQNPHNPLALQWLARQRLAPAMALAVVAYALAFLGQPSLLGFTDEDGEPLTRWIDISMLLMGEQILAGLGGSGRFQTGIADRLPIAAAGAAWLALAAAIGTPWVRQTGLVGRLSRLEVHALSILSGLALLSTLTLLVGLCGGLHSRWPLIGGIAALLVASWLLDRWRRRLASEADEAEEEQHPGNSKGVSAGLLQASASVPARSLFGVWLRRLLPVGVAGLVCIHLLGSLMTPYEFDVVEYHLQAPKEFAAAGSIDFNDHNVYANMPLGAEMHSLAMMTLIGSGRGDGWWWGGLVGKFIIGSFSLIAAALLGGFIARRLGNWSGWGAAALLLSAPGNLHVAQAGLIDSVVGAYALATVAVWSSRWGRARLADCLLLASLLAGAAAACKYPGMVFVVIPLVLATCVWMARARFSLATQAKLLAAGALGLCLTCLPWLVKNVVQTGNPVFPLMANLFGGRGLDAARVEQWQNAHQVPSFGGSTYGPTAMLHAADQLFLSSPFLSPTQIGLVACGLVAYVTVRYRAERVATAADDSDWFPSWLGLSVWMLAVWWLATHRIDRFWLPVLPLYAGLAAVGVAWIGRSLSVSVATGLVLLSVAFAAFLSASGALGDNRFFVRLEELRTDAGNAEQPGRMSPTTLWINQHLDRQQSHVLLIGEARVFDFEPPIQYATCFNDNPAEHWLRGKSEVEQRENLREAGVTHLFIHWGEIARYRSPGNYGFSDWPRRGDVESLIERGVVERVAWPFENSQAELLKVIP